MVLLYMNFERLVTEHKHSFQTPRFLSELFKAHRSFKIYRCCLKSHKNPATYGEVAMTDTVVNLQNVTMAFNHSKTSLDVGKAIL